MKTARFFSVWLLSLLVLIVSPNPRIEAATGDLEALEANIVGIGISATVTQPDGKIILAGNFTSVLGVPRRHIARLNVDGTLDMDYNPNPNAPVYCALQQPDGKVVFGGDFITMQPNAAGSPVTRNRIARVNADGTLDALFGPSVSGGPVHTAVLLPDGRIIIGGSFFGVATRGALGGHGLGNICRMAADGTVDPFFDPRTNGPVHSIALQPDGKIVVGGAFGQLHPFGTPTPTPRHNVARINPDNTLDPGFYPTANAAVYAVAVQPNGKILLGGFFNALQPNGAPAPTARNCVARVLADGTVDPDFDPSADNGVVGFALQADGRILMTGNFSNLQPNKTGPLIPRSTLARVFDNGEVDPSLVVTPNAAILNATLQADGKILVSGLFTTLQPQGTGPAVPRSFLARLENDPANSLLTISAGKVTWTRVGGSPEVEQVTFELSTDSGATWLPLPAPVRDAGNWIHQGLLPKSGMVRARGRTVGGYSCRSQAMVEQTASYTAQSGTATGPDLQISGVWSSTVQADGKVVIGGPFTSVFGMPYRYLARLNVDGTLDQTFRPQPNSQVETIVVQPDGKLLVGGYFTEFRPNDAPTPTVRLRAARINPDGTVDAGFDPNFNGAISSLRLQPDGKVVAMGYFSGLQPAGTPSFVARQFMTRLNADGTMDMGFDPKPNGFVLTGAVQADGKIMFTGGFSSLQPNGAAAPTTRINVARVHPDGSLDLSFAMTLNSSASGVAVQADGKTLVGGFFSAVTPPGSGSIPRNGIMRINPDGSLDMGFNPGANFGGKSLSVQADGKILVAGGGNNIARLNPNGSVDPTFVNLVPTMPVSGLIPDAQGRIVATHFGFPGVLRLYNDAATQTLSIPSQSKVEWTRGGTAPELSHVFFEVSTNGGTNWAPLGAGVRAGTTANWQLTGLTLPANGLVRACGFSHGGDETSSSGLVEQITTFDFTTETPLLTAVGSAAYQGRRMSVSFTLPEAPLTGSVKLTFTPTGGGPPVVFTLGEQFERVGAHSFSFDPDAPMTSGYFASSMALVDGTYSVALSYQSAGGHPVATSTVVPGVEVGSGPAPAGVVDGLNVAVTGGSVSTTATQPDGKILLAGNFTSVLGTARNRIARLNADGTLDMSFNPNASGQVNSLAVQLDGKIVIAGFYESLQPNGAALGIRRNRVARLNPDGTLDTIFDPAANQTVQGLALQPDGKVLLSGFFSALQPNESAASTTRQRLARVNADGTLDTGFELQADNEVNHVAVLPDGRLLISGNFVTMVPNFFSPIAFRNRLALLNADGSPADDISPNPNGPVRCVVVQQDGGIVLGGAFTAVHPAGAPAPIARGRLARLNADGTLDANFNPNVDGEVMGMSAQADGKLVVWGAFTSAQPPGAPAAITRRYALRLNADGTLDAGFDPNFNNVVNTGELQADGKILFGGQFTALQPAGEPASISRAGLARVESGPAQQIVGLLNPTHVFWQRGGSVPDLEQVTFDFSGDGGAHWTPLGVGTRAGATSHWELTGLSLPAGGTLRARGRVRSGTFNGSSSIVQQVSHFDLATEAPELIAPASNVRTGSPVTVTFRLPEPAAPDSLTIQFGGVLMRLAPSMESAGLHTFTFDPANPLASPAIEHVFSGTITDGPKTVTVTFMDVARHLQASDTHSNVFLDRTTLPPTLFAPGTGQTIGNTMTVDFLLPEAAAPGSVKLRFQSGPASQWLTLASGFETAALHRVTFSPSEPDFSADVVGGSPLLPGVYTVTVEYQDDFANPVAASALAANVTLAHRRLTSLNPSVQGTFVFASTLQADRKVLIGGNFVTTPDFSRNNIARMNADGTMDADFTPSASDHVYAFAVQEDGKIVTAGRFTFIRPTGSGSFLPAVRLARLHADGTLDTSFSPQVNSDIYSVVIQPDGKIVVGGNFTMVRGTGDAVDTPRRYVVRFHPNGTLDTTFDPSANAIVYMVHAQRNGQLLLGGEFTALQPNGAPAPISRRYLARLNPDGTLDAGFNPDPNAYVSCAVEQADGKLVIGGQYTTLQPNGAPAATQRLRLARIHPDGSLDASFNPRANNNVETLALQSDGRIVLGGYFTTLQPEGAPAPTQRVGIARVNANGAVDANFNPNPNNAVYSVLIEADGSVLFNGLFNSLQPNGNVPSQARNFMARYENDPAMVTLGAPNATRAVWTRGGTAPVFSRVGFEFSSDGESWVPLGAGAPVPNTHHWEITGVSLPVTGFLRGRGIMGGGVNSGTTNVIEQVSAYTADIATLAPSLHTPADHAHVSGLISVDFELPENALPGSVMLTIGSTLFTLAPSLELAGTHQFTFDLADPLASPEIESVTGDPVLDGSYFVTLFYSDAAGNLPVGDTHINVVVDRAAPAGGTFTAEPTPIAAGGLITGSFAGWVDASGPLTYSVRNGAMVIVPAGSDAVPAFVLPIGTHTLTGRISDALGQFTDVTATVTVFDPEPAFIALYAKDAPVPVAGTDPRIQTGAKWFGFGVPALNGAGSVAYLGKWKAPAATTPSPLPAQSGVGIFVDDDLLAKVGEPVPGIADAVFKAFKDPVIDASGHVIFIATIKGATTATVIPATSDTVVVSNGRTGALEVIAREGTPAPGTGGALFRAFTSVSVKDDPNVTGATGQTAILFTATLLPATGSPAVTTANDTGAWLLPTTSSDLTLIVREGQSHPVTGDPVKSFLLLNAIGGSPAHGRGQVEDNDSIGLVNVVRSGVSRPAVVRLGHGIFEDLARIGDNVGDATLPAATWTKLGMPSSSHTGENLSLLGTVSGVPVANARGVFRSLNSGATWNALVRLGDTAPGFAGSTFSGLKDPVNSSTGAALAFAGLATSGDATPATNDAIWFQPEIGPLRLVAREGSEPPGAPGAKWKSFSSLVLPGGDTGPLFTANLLKGVAGTPGPGGITAINDFGLYSANAHGAVKELIREGQPLLGKTVRTFNVLKVASGSAGTTRAFNHSREVVVLVTFNDKSTAIVGIQLPAAE